MKKLLKSVVAVLMSTICFWGNCIVVNGQGSNTLNDYIQKSEWKYLLTSKNYQYKQLADTIRSSVADQYLLSIIDFYINTGAEPDKRKYEEVLMNIIMTSEYNTSEKISEQYKMDKMKSGKEYLMDAKDAVNSALKIYSGMHGNGDEWEEALVTAIDSLSTFTDNADNWLSALCDLETVLYNYGKLDELLNYIYENSSGELKKAAQELNSGMKSLMCIKLEMYNDVSNKNFQNYTELLFTDSLFKAVKLSDEYASDDSLKFFVDKADDLFNKLDVMKSSWDLGTIIGKTIGNVAVGGENIIRRVHEIEALSDIEDVLSNKILEEQNVLLGNQTIENLQNYVYDCNILTGTHIRGEYCVYSIIAKDAGWLSLLNFSKAEDAKQWYDLKTERILKISSNLENLLNDFKSEEMKDYEWQLKPTIEADNIIVPDYNDELFEKYAIIEKGGKYGLISNEGEYVEDVKYNTFLICKLAKSYSLGNDRSGRKTAVISDYTMDDKDYIGYKMENGNLVRTSHGGHGSDSERYYYNTNDNKVYKIQGIGDGYKEYKRDEIVLARSASISVDQNYKCIIKKINDEYYLVNKKGKFKDIAYENGNNVCPESNDYIIYAQKNKKWHYYNNNGIEITSKNIKTYYSSLLDSGNIRNDDSMETPFMAVNGIVAVNTDDGGCFYDVSGNQLTDPSEFEEVRPMINNFAWVKKDGKWGVIKLNAFETNDNIDKSLILNSVNKYLTDNVNGENNFYIFESDILENDNYWETVIRWDGSQSLANVMSGYMCRVYKNDGTAEIYFFDNEDSVLESFNVFDYREDNVNSTENSKKETGIVKIDDGYLNVRESPSIDGKIISKLYNGDEVIINGTSDDGKWIEVSKESIKGYVSKDFIVKN